MIPAPEDKKLFEKGAFFFYEKTQKEGDTADKKEKTATTSEITDFWTSILRDEEADLKDRLKVSELLAKILGATADETPASRDPLEGMTLEEKLGIIESIRRPNR